MATDRSLRNGMTVFFFFFFFFFPPTVVPLAQRIPQGEASLPSLSPVSLAALIARMLAVKRAGPRGEAGGWHGSLEALEPKWLRTARYVTA
mmetsp:Transcript_3772/g.2973  ORF Transcript_3772/g.2973 Transcript_3772/m.2973 type:complete len:91 (+) Transcript_3772:197-469(+)